MRAERGSIAGAKRASPVARGWLAAVLALALSAAAAAAQVPPVPPDTVPQDTVRVPIPPEEVSGDTIPAVLRAAAASEAMVDAFPDFPRSGAPGWQVARWEWDRQHLAGLHGLTLLEFIERLPGMVRYRAGGFGRPEAVTALGMGGGRMRVLLDGYELDPLGPGAFELETLSLTDLERVRVERTLTGIRVDIETFRLPDPEPYSVVELGTGVYQTRVLRSLFSRGFGARSVAVGAFDLATTSGIGLRERYGHTNAALRWSYAVNDDLGLQAEFRRTAIDRAELVYPQETTRTDLVVRGRGRLGDRLTLDSFLGRSTRDEAAGEVPEEAAAVQGGVRGALTGERVAADASLRFRGGVRGQADVPSMEAEASASFRPLARLALEGTALSARGAGTLATSARVTASFAPLPAFTFFGSAEGGSRLVRTLSFAAPDDSVSVTELIVADAAGFRLGGEAAAAFGAVGVAAFRTTATAVAPFGLAFDRGTPVVEAGAATGVETYFDLVVPGTRGLARLEGSYQSFVETTDRPYTPPDHGRLGLSVHGLFFGDQLEPRLLVEGVHRSAALVPAAPGAPPFTVMPGHVTMNLALQIRIQDVRAFLVWDNLVRVENAVDLPGVPPPFPRIVYGASWVFRN